MSWYVKVKNTAKSEELKKSGGLPVGEVYWRVFQARFSSEAVQLAEQAGYEVIRVTDKLSETKE